MNTADIDQQISNFLTRKHAEFPEIAASRRNGSRTVKYAVELRRNGQLLFTY